ncbi:hypothetical protein SODALDRAFT_356111 [Sodiomyces alkalinus F11]|uniref:Serine-rich protein n=1 Tax=Sodiomyces alkalinus (strain CBS 110278 / VKM F-3762 / F11) TaxID=1314773 RepID=A0A3N2Q066_SODAK|nr:hypothetical protein SODALDRAFT_356111 [Sodiomyces alkalinus F11]ROT40164.1 hypothetical protein SODALDRAFT_356111 [Sodiomyces alkalinus F11]
MSASFPPHREPLSERSQSQTNSLAIRIVPYSPPRPSDSPSAASPSAAQHDKYDARADDDFAHEHFTPSDVYGSAPVVPSPGSGSPMSPRPLAAVRGRPVVSNPKVRSGSRPCHPSTHVTPVSEAPSVSSRNPTATSDISDVYALSGLDREQGLATAPRRPLSRRRNLVNIHPNSKTFSLQPQTQPAFQDAFRPSSFSLSTASSFERLSSSDWPSEGRPSSPLTTLPERSASPSTPASCSVEWTADQNPSPCNYRLVGGLRKVPETPGSKPGFSTDLPQASSSPSSHSHLPALLETEAVDRSPYPSLTNKGSFLSSHSVSTRSETTNYKVYAASSPVAVDTAVEGDSLPPPSSSDSNYPILGRSSPPVPSTPDFSQPDTAASDANYVLHGDPSPSSPSLVVAARRLRPEFSQESLVVPPLRPAKKKPSSETLASSKSRSSRLFHKGSLTSISSVFGGQEAIRSVLLGPMAWLYQPEVPSVASTQPQHPRPSASSSAPPSQPAPFHMVSHPRQWSSQLSTVASEGEGPSDLTSRSSSLLSAPDRRSSGFSPSHAREIPRVSSRFPLDANQHARSKQPDVLVEEPMPTYNRAGMTLLVKDQDEHGDGLADLHQLHNRPSRRRLSSFLSNTSSDRHLHSSGSSRTNSFNTSSLPAWARLYYGNGEPRRWLRQATSLESMAGYYDNSRPPSSFRSASPSMENASLHIHTRRQTPTPQEAPCPPAAPPRTLVTEPEEIVQIPVGSPQVQPALSKQTSSIWSPHLARDQRASRYSIWEPPSVYWSGEGGFLGRRNIQLVLFVVGFIFPFAWMIASCLPLPHKPQPGQSNVPGELAQIYHEPSYGELEYRSSRWWRNLNRCMSILGLLIIGAIIALAVVGVTRGWGRNSS